MYDTPSFWIFLVDTFYRIEMNNTMKSLEIISFLNTCIIWTEALFSIIICLYTNNYYAGVKL